MFCLCIVVVWVRVYLKYAYLLKIFISIGVFEGNSDSLFKDNPVLLLSIPKIELSVFEVNYKSPIPEILSIPSDVSQSFNDYYSQGLIDGFKNSLEVTSKRYSRAYLKPARTQRLWL